MALKYIHLTQVICDRCGKSIMLMRWQDATKLGWAAPIDGAVQHCPDCNEQHRSKLFAEAKLAQILEKCPLGDLSAGKEE